MPTVGVEMDAVTPRKSYVEWKNGVILGYPFIFTPEKMSSAVSTAVSKTAEMSSTGSELDADEENDENDDVSIVC